MGLAQSYLVLLPPGYFLKRWHCDIAVQNVSTLPSTLQLCACCKHCFLRVPKTDIKYLSALRANIFAHKVRHVLTFLSCLPAPPAQKCAPRRRLRALTDSEAGSGSRPPEKMPAMLEAKLLRPSFTALATLDTWRRGGKQRLADSP